jgi:hypothetical protein
VPAVLRLPPLLPKPSSTHARVRRRGRGVALSSRSIGDAESKNLICDRKASQRAKNTENLARFGLTTTSVSRPLLKQDRTRPRAGTVLVQISSHQTDAKTVSAWTACWPPVNSGNSFGCRRSRHLSTASMQYRPVVESGVGQGRAGRSRIRLRPRPLQCPATGQGTPHTRRRPLLAPPPSPKIFTSVGQSLNPYQVRVLHSCRLSGLK